MADSNEQPPPPSNMEINDDLDASLEADINPDATQLQPEAMNLDGANDAEPSARNGVADATATLEARIPAKKDATLREFMNRMDEFAPIVCSRLSAKIHSSANKSPDTGRGHQLLSHTRRSPAPSVYLPSPYPPRCTSGPEVHRRHRRGFVSILPHSGL
jgi:hypothetical protein